MIAMAMEYARFFLPISVKSFAVPNFLPHTIISFFSIRIDWNWLTNRFLLSSFVVVSSLLFFSFFLLHVCTSWSITIEKEPFVVIHTHYIYDLRRFSLNFVCNRTKQSNNNKREKCIYHHHCYRLSNTARTHIFHLIQKYTFYSAAADSLCYSLLHMRFDRIFIFFFVSSAMLSDSIVRSISMGFNSFSFFFFTHCEKKVTRLLFYCCAMSLSVDRRQQETAQKLIENAAVVSRRLRNTHAIH